MSGRHAFFWDASAQPAHLGTDALISLDLAVSGAYNPYREAEFLSQLEQFCLTRTAVTGGVICENDYASQWARWSCWRLFRWRWSRPRRPRPHRRATPP